jgi:hypothetical protein
MLCINENFGRPSVMDDAEHAASFHAQPISSPQKGNVSVKHINTV